MTFVTVGLALAGIACVAIPIIIHLLWRQRKRPVDWAAMRFLIEAFKKQKRRLQVEQILLLVVRCLIVALLGIALARPLLRASGVLQGDDTRVVLLVIDNGIASAVAETTDADNTALARHKAQARDVIEALGPTESVGVITTARPIAPPVLPPSIDHGAVGDVIESIESSEAPADIAAALRAAREAAVEFEDDGRNVVVYLLSDFRAGSAPLDVPLPELFDANADDSAFTLLAAPPATDPSTNVQVVSIDPVRRLVLPGANDGAQQVTVRLERHGGDLGRSTSRVRLQGEAIGTIEPRMVQWEPGQSAASVTFDLNYDRAHNQEIGITAIIDDADALDLDNRFNLTLDVRERVRIAMVSPPTFLASAEFDKLSTGQWIRWALQPLESGPMDIVDILPSNLTDVDLRGVDVAIVTRPDRLTDLGWRALRHYVDDGGMVLFVPPAELNVHPWTDRLASELDLPWRIALETAIHVPPLAPAREQPPSELFKLLAGEFSYLLLTVTADRTLPIDPVETQAETVLQFDDGSPLMILGAPARDATAAAGDDARMSAGGSGLVAYLAVAPRTDWTSLPLTGFMTPLFQETVRQGLSIVRGSQSIRVGEQPAVIGLARGAVTLVGPDGRAIDVDRNRRPDRPLGRSGLYAVQDGSDTVVGRIAVNVDARSARTDVQSEAAVKAWLDTTGPWKVFDAESPAAALAQGPRGRSIARYLLAALLVLVIAETILARRFSHAYRTKDSASLTGGLRPTMAEVRP